MPYTALISNLRSLPQETLTSDQREALLSLLDYLEAPSPYALYLLTGYAGTGKTIYQGREIHPPPQGPLPQRDPHQTE